MGWDFHVEMETGAAEASVVEQTCRNYTHNCNSMMRRALDAVGALGGLGDAELYALDKKPCTEVSALLEPAIEWWRANRQIVVELAPINGFGNEPGALAFWSAVQSLCAEHSRAVCRLGG